MREMGKKKGAGAAELFDHHARHRARIRFVEAAEKERHDAIARSQPGQAIPIDLLLRQLADTPSRFGIQVCVRAAEQQADFRFTRCNQGFHFNR
jgi:hypothetical protein